ncbi:MAG: signal peptidase I [Proteobacteria bacterium]|nr:signal peptidase I [Pseudomonadota bacterium]
MARTQENKISEAQEGSKDFIRALLVSILALIIIRSFVFESFKIPSSSMVPTLHIGDHIFVSKFDYGISLPFTKIELIRWSQPKRGDVIVFLFPKDESLHYVKRVLGVPGDKIEFKGRALFVNGEKIDQELITDPVLIEKAYSGGPVSGELYQENLKGRTHWVRYLNPREKGFSDMKQEVTVPPDKFFVVGDNRDQSYDSRSWGYVSRDSIKGRARMIWLSLKSSDDWISFRRVAWSRSGKLIR